MMFRDNWVGGRFNTESGHALLPEDKERTNTLSNMPPYGGGWTVPWAMWVDGERRCWLYPRYTFSDRPGGTVSLRVDRTEDGYVVDTRLCSDSKWEPQEHHGYFGGPQPLAFIPVARLI